MKKNELREQGYAEETRWPKSSGITAIWALFTSLIVAVTIIFSIFSYSIKYNVVLEFFDETANKVNSFFHTIGATSIIYLVLWFAMCATIYYLVKKPKYTKSILLRVILIVLIIAVIFTFMLLVSDHYNHTEDEESKPYAFYGIFDYAIIFIESLFYELHLGELSLLTVAIMMIFFQLMYLGLRLAATTMFRTSKDSTKFAFLRGMPICSCKEAFTPRDTVAMYLLPFAFMYMLLYILNIRSENFYYAVIIVFLSLSMGLDFAGMIYIIHLKNKEKVKYISLDNHLYQFTLFRK